ncbi:MAG: ABC transporter permease [Lachnospiraceae bacterium]|nr:ABC transporter permease [Lachnospiraceae bacterium]
MLLRKMRRDLFASKVQFLSIFLMSLLGIFVFVGLDSECNGMRVHESRFYEGARLADLWAQGTAFKEADIDKAEYIPNIKKAELRLKLDGKAVIRGNELDLSMLFMDGNEISRLHLTDGEPYVKGASGVWLDFNFLKKQGLKIGDKLSMKVNGNTFEQEIKGTVYHPEYVYFLPDAAAMMPDYGAYGAAFMDFKAYPDSKQAYYNQMILDVEGVDNTDGLSEKEKNQCSKAALELKYALGSDKVIVTDKDSDLSYQTFRAEIEQHSSMTFIFPAVFLMIAILGIITTMTRMTSRQRIQIGTLKALGFSKRTITIHYASYGFFLSLAGGIAGAFLGHYTIAGYILGMMDTTYLVPNMGTVFSSGSYLAIVLSVLISSAVSFASCRKELAPMPAETLRPASPKNLRHSLIEKSRLWERLDFTVQWNLRDILRNKVRSLMGVIGVLGCSMLMFAAFACLDTVSFITTWMYGELNTSQFQIIMKESCPYSTVEEYAKRYKGQMVEQAAAEFEVSGTKKTGTVTVYDIGNFLHFQDEELRPLKLKKDGISISYKMAQNLGVRKGDLVRWHLIGDEEWKNVRISDIYRNPASQGITMTRETFENLHYSFVPGTIYTNHTPEEKLEDDTNIVGTQSLPDMMKALDSMKEMMYAMVYIMIAAAAVLGIVVLYNLGVLSLVEKNREMATLKVLGFTTAKIRRILQSQNIWLTLIGIALGIPSGMWLINMLFSTMPESMDYVASYRPLSYAYTIIGTLVLSMGVNRLLSRKVKTVDMVDALKGQE